MIKRTTLLCTAAIALAAGSVSAQYAGPGASPAFSSVIDVLNSAPDDAHVELVGYVTRQVGKEKYLFHDGTGEIRVEIEAEHFPKVRIDEKTKVRIGGEVEKEFLQSPEIDVDHITLL
ncbi:YgiW/YdeI family stress tolerance OB fold protein [Variovorax sp. HJSM1_2]|uniref:YgiW/YdeI family stress tolerance OB fold protein n=1 Tax=Variovorax sp. HJSM1_2 TaxID=3366263 RepID=UPI003BE20BD9